MASPTFTSVGGYVNTGLTTLSTAEDTAVRRELAKLKAVYRRDAQTNKSKSPDFDMMHPQMVEALDREVDALIAIFSA